MQYRVISADSHVTEPPDLWSKYIESEFEDRAPRIVAEKDTDSWVMEGVPIWPLGIMTTLGKDRDKIGPNDRFSESVRPGAYDSRARVKDVDPDGVDAEVVFPTVALRLYGMPDTDLMYASMRAYNDWMADFSDAVPGRYRGISLIALVDMEQALDEIRRTRKKGLYPMIAIDSGDPTGYSDRRYDPLWATAQELDVPVSMHVLSERQRVIESTDQDAWKHLNQPGGVAVKQLGPPEPRSPIGPTIQSMIVSGVFERNPELKIVAVEVGCSWAVPLMERLDEWARGDHTGLRQVEGWTGNKLPSEYFHQNVYMTFIRDKMGVKCREAIGMDNIMWSSDFPHPTSTWPNSQRVLDEHFDGVPEEDKRQIVCENASRIFGFPV